MILITGSYNVVGPDNAPMFIGLKDVATGPAYTQAAVEGLMPGFGQAFVAIALFFFAFTTILSYYYISETNVSYINRKLHRPFLFFILKLFVMGSCIFGAVKTADLAWAVGDIGVGLMAWLNIIAILLLNKKAFLCLRDYEKQLAIGLDRFSIRKNSASRTPTTGSVNVLKKFATRNAQNSTAALDKTWKAMF